MAKHDSKGVGRRTKQVTSLLPKVEPATVAVVPKPSRSKIASTEPRSKLEVGNRLRWKALTGPVVNRGGDATASLLGTKLEPAGKSSSKRAKDPLVAFRVHDLDFLRRADDPPEVRKELHAAYLRMPSKNYQRLLTGHAAVTGPFGKLKARKGKVRDHIPANSVNVAKGGTREAGLAILMPKEQDQASGPMYGGRQRKEDQILVGGKWQPIVRKTFDVKNTAAAVHRDVTEGLENIEEADQDDHIDRLSGYVQLAKRSTAEHLASGGTVGANMNAPAFTVRKTRDAKGGVTYWYTPKPKVPQSRVLGRVVARHLLRRRLARRYAPRRRKRK